MNTWNTQTVEISKVDNGYVIEWQGKDRWSEAKDGVQRTGLEVVKTHEEVVKRVAELLK